MFIMRSRGRELQSLKIHKYISIPRVRGCNKEEILIDQILFGKIIATLNWKFSN
jgi:hypothetical protein